MVKYRNPQHQSQNEFTKQPYCATMKVSLNKQLSFLSSVQPQMMGLGCGEGLVIFSAAFTDVLVFSPLMKPL